MSRATLVIWVVYVVLLVGMCAGLAVARRSALQSLGGTDADQRWEEWRAEAERQEDGAGPVSRRKPKSDQPPTLVLLRDHFATSLAILVALTSAVYFTIALMVRGVLAGPQFKPDLVDADAPR